MSEKYNAALGAYELITKEEGPLVLGIGTGSTTDYFTKNFLPNLSNKLKCVYSSSNRTTSLLNDLGFMVKDYDQNAVIDIYVDGADEVDKNLNLRKGGGGAHTNEKRLAKIANQFICIVDDSKIVDIDDDNFLDLDKVPSDSIGIIVTHIFGNICDISKYEKWCKENNKFLIFEIPLLIESKLMKHYDKIIFVNSRKDLRLKRYLKRGNNKRFFNLLNNSFLIAESLKHGVTSIPPPNQP